MSNISIARNACLAACDADFLAFIDDDEIATSTWLVDLFEMAETTGASAVLGPVRAVYSDNMAMWLTKGDFHSTRPVWVKRKIKTGYTCNVLLDMSSSFVTGRRFDLSLGQTGGEDTDFFDRLTADGGTIEFSPTALVLEPVAAHRANFSWLVKRRFRSGQTHGRLAATKFSPIGKLLQSGLACAKACYCLLLMMLYWLKPTRRFSYALRAALHVGSTLGFLGAREIRLYGKLSAP